MSTKMTDAVTIAADHPVAAWVEPAVARKATRLLAEYLRHWGLRDPIVIAAHCRRWIALARVDAHDNEDGIARMALEHARRDIERWIDCLALRISATAKEAESRRGLVAIAVRGIVDDHAEAFLNCDHVPQTLVDRLAERAWPVVPIVGQQAQMAGPPLGKLPALLQPRKWRRAVTRLTSAVLVFAGFQRS
jgi:hypothetical protein